MTNKEFLKKLELKLMSYEVRVRDLERENASLRAQLVQSKELLAEKK